MNRDNETSHLFQLLQRVNSLYERDASPAEVEAFRERTRAVWELALDRPQMRRPKVFVGTPYHTSIHPDTIAATKQWATDDNLEVVVGRVCSSLLANGCNQLVVEALKAKADLFCLLHADMVPRFWRQLPGRGHWLDMLVRDLYANGLDALHVPAAIKDYRGITSTAIGRKAHAARWQHVKKLSLRELSLLPKVFTIADCEAKLDLTCFGRMEELCLLPNTGCLLVRLDKLREHRFPGFAFQDELHWDAEGNAVAATVPEDWWFGRWCAHEGLKVGGTTNLATTHVGPHEFVSDQDWGCVLSEYGGEVTAKVF